MYVIYSLLTMICAHTMVYTCILICHIYFSYLLCLYICLHAALLFGYWLIAKGWTITRDSLAMEDWRLLIIAIALFYMFSSILEVLYSTILNNTGYWILVTLLYASMYGAIFYHLQYELFKVHFHVSFLRPTMASNITGPLREKYFMFQCFLGLVASSFILEIICQVMVAKGVQYYSVLSLYEVISLIIITSIGWLFRPRELSPFFFMIPARPTDARSR